MRKNNYTLNERYFQSLQTPTQAYLLGIIASDGCVTNTNYFALQMNDLAPLELLQRELRYTGSIRYPRPESGRINFSSKDLVADLSQYQIGPTKSKTFAWLPTRDTWAFLLGYFDGDGSAYRNKGRSGGLVNIIATHQMCSLIQQHLGYGTLLEHKKSEMWYWRCFSKENIARFYNYIYQDTGLGLSRKRLIMEDIATSYVRK